MLCLTQENLSSLWLSQYFCRWGGLVHAKGRGAVKTRGEGGGPNGQRKCFMFAYVLACLSIGAFLLRISVIFWDWLCTERLSVRLLLCRASVVCAFYCRRMMNPSLLKHLRWRTSGLFPVWE